MLPTMNSLEPLFDNGRLYLIGSSQLIANFTLLTYDYVQRFVSADLLGKHRQLLAWDAYFLANPATKAGLKW
jgi:hypothetical protein